MYFMAARTFASASKTELPFLASSVPDHVPERYWKTPLADELLFLLNWLNPDSSLAIQSGTSGLMAYCNEYCRMSS
jgi:hypothetical protein